MAARKSSSTVPPNPHQPGRPGVFATKLRTKAPDKFHVGQRCVLVLDEASGWAPFDGEPCTITGPKMRRSLWCHDWDGGNRNFQRRSERYAISFAGGELCVRESQLRARDGDELSTWDKFEKLTGINPRGELATVKRTLRPKSTA